MATKMVPKLEAMNRCVDVPREVCVSVRRPRKEFRPVVKIWCNETKEVEKMVEEEREEPESSTLMLVGGTGIKRLLYICCKYLWMNSSIFSNHF